MAKTSMVERETKRQKTVAKYGCYGCHDVPNFEDAKPIGVGLADWGRKDPSKIEEALEAAKQFAQDKIG